MAYIARAPFGLQEVFRHVDTDGTVRCFSVPVLLDMIREKPDDWQLTERPIGRADAAFVTRNRGVDEQRVRAYPLAKLDEPGIAAAFPDTSVLIVDGNHRLVKRVRRGLRTMQFWVAEEEIWKHALVPEGSLVTFP